MNILHINTETTYLILHTLLTTMSNNTKNYVTPSTIPPAPTKQQLDEMLKDYSYFHDSVLLTEKFITGYIYKLTGVVMENIRVGAIIAVKFQNNIYVSLVKENAIEARYSKWGFPKGGIEAGDTLTGDNDDGILNFTARREIMEELNYPISPIELGRRSLILVDVPQKRDSTVPDGRVYVNGKFTTNLAYIKPTLNAYFLLTLDAVKHNFDIRDPYKNRTLAHTDTKLKQIWLPLTPDYAKKFPEVYKETNRSTILALDRLVQSLDSLEFD